MARPQIIWSLVATATALALGACSASTEPVNPGTPSAQSVTVQIVPRAPSVPVNGTTLFAAAVTGTANTAVNWTVVESGGGSVTGAGLYTAPASPGTFHVRATSAASAAAYDEAAVTVRSSVSVSVSPATVAVDACRTFQFTATVGGATNASVTWSVQEGSGGGSIASSGLYTAPSAAGTYHVVATSVEDPSRSAVSTVTVSDRVLSVTVNPPTATLTPGATAQFTATVTTTCGAFASTTMLAVP